MWFPTLEILCALPWNGSSFHSRTKHFRAFYMDVTKFTSQKLEHHRVTTFSSRASVERKRETELRVQIELGIRIRENFHENIFEIEAENLAVDIKICDERLRICSWIFANSLRDTRLNCDRKSRAKRLTIYKVVIYDFIKLLTHLSTSCIYFKDANIYVVAVHLNACNTTYIYFYESLYINQMNDVA